MNCNIPCVGGRVQGALWKKEKLKLYRKNADQEASKTANRPHFSSHHSCYYPADKHKEDGYTKKDTDVSFQNVDSSASLSITTGVFLKHL